MRGQGDPSIHGRPLAAVEPPDFWSSRFMKRTSAGLLTLSLTPDRPDDRRQLMSRSRSSSTEPPTPMYSSRMDVWPEELGRCKPRRHGWVLSFFLETAQNCQAVLGKHSVMEAAHASLRRLKQIQNDVLSRSRMILKFGRGEIRLSRCLESL